MLKFQIGIQACFTTVTDWRRFSSLKYRWKQCHADLILSKKKKKKKKKKIIVTLPPPCSQIKRFYNDHPPSGVNFISFIYVTATPTYVRTHTRTRARARSHAHTDFRANLSSSLEQISCANAANELNYFTTDILGAKNKNK